LKPGCGLKVINGQPGICLEIVKFLQNFAEHSGGADSASNCQGAAKSALLALPERTGGVPGGGSTGNSVANDLKPTRGSTSEVWVSFNFLKKQKTKPASSSHGRTRSHWRGMNCSVAWE
jgi:predicted outer membrane repeat protein